MRIVAPEADPAPAFGAAIGIAPPRSNGHASMPGFSFALLALLMAALAVAGCSPVGALNALAEPDASRRVTGIAYGSDPRQRLDVYVPAKRTGPYPVVLFFFGGSWNSGARADYGFVGEALASRGVLTVIADYRLFPQVRYPEFLEDSAQAAAWIGAQVQTYGGDRGRIYVMGHSAGAYNAAMLALDPRWLAKAGASATMFAGFIGLAGPYDFLPIENREVRPVFFYPDSPPDSQPILYANPGSPRSFLAAPGSDDLVDPERSTHQLARKLAANGVAVTYRSYPNVGHVTLIGAMSRPLRWLAPVLDDIDEFIRSDGKP
jgi:acetyl esterase/lipase